MLHRILGGIYLSSIDPVDEGIDFKREHGITHVLSVLPGALPEYLSKEYHHLQVEVTDEETSDLLEHFPATTDFIDGALFPSSATEGAESKKHQGAILVHCAQGESRSVAVVVAYLMYKYKLSYAQALHAVKRKVAGAEPNYSFVRQIKLFETMGFEVDQSSEEYRAFLQQMRSESKDPEAVNWQMSRGDAVTTEAGKATNFRCKKCRHVLATGDEVEYHEPPTSDSRQAQFVKRAFNSRRVISAIEASKNCSHFFLGEPLEWMQPELSKQELEGKFFCPKCTAKVGAYSWKGSRCSCGKWMIPALHIQAAKVDVMKASKPALEVVMPR